jgi:hypothetical protein
LEFTEAAEAKMFVLIFCPCPPKQDIKEFSNFPLKESKRLSFHKYPSYTQKKGIALFLKTQRCPEESERMGLTASHDSFPLDNTDLSSTFFCTVVHKAFCFFESSFL